jgi:hypothetical protein
MVSGTSTGSLLTTAIVIPSPDNPKINKFWAADASNIYKVNGSEVFKKFEFPISLRILGSLCLAILGGGFGFFICTKILFFSALHEKTMETFSKYFESRSPKAIQR